MELRRYLAVLRNRWLLIVVTVAVALSAGYAVSPRDAQYNAEATIFLGSTNVQTGPTEGLSNDFLTALDRIALTYSILIESGPIAARAIEITGLERSVSDVVRSTNAQPEPATQLLYIRFSDEDPEVAQAVTNALAQGFLDAVDELDAPGLPVSVSESAGLPTVPEDTGLLRNLVLAGLFGLLASVGLCFLLEYLDVTIRNPDDVERRLELPVLGVVPTFGRELPIEPAAVLRAEQTVARRGHVDG